MWILLHSTVPAGPRDVLLIPTPRDSSANKKPPYFQLPVYPNGLLAHNSLPNLPPFSLKKRAPHLFPRQAYSSAEAYTFWIAILFYSRINLSLADKINGMVKNQMAGKKPRQFLFLRFTATSFRYSTATTMP